MADQEFTLINANQAKLKVLYLEPVSISWMPTGMNLGIATGF